ncbi:CYTH-like domain-containing protein [Truncatella angustata]|uniref:Thiamine-triphosphatase n=1 Tax=Truncatella angustata TaxID=152316 RepID=A0A9P8UDW0_9PEZI|nr:CYTH-like domain-containing protein [Truncatella angustata]KAH6648118.1 CYTH-like domain-containing protein [Truncatella angustata]
MFRMLNISTKCTSALPRISRRSRKLASTHSGAVQFRQLEVERKFLATPSAISYLRSNGEGSRFKKYKSLGVQINHDVYYDRDGVLFSKGVYIRRRNGHWEAKIRTGGNFINSAFREIGGDKAVTEVVQKSLTVTADGAGIEKLLEPCAEFITDRESWIIDGKFRVDVDTTDFGHTVGEVELTEVLQSASGEQGEEQEEEKNLREKMNQEIKAFMQTYPPAFPTGRPIGKLSAYFQKVGRET